MTWTKLSDDALDKQPELSVSRSARLLNLEAMLRCNRTLSNGVITRAELPRVSDSPDIDGDVSELVRAGIWSVLGKDSWQVDWSDQEDAADVLRRQELNKERKRRWRQHTSGDHSACDPSRCLRARQATGDETRDATRDETGDETPTRTFRPGPSGPVRSEGPGQDQDDGGPAHAGAPPADAATKASARLGRLPHPWSDDCCPLPDNHPIHWRAS